MSSVMGQNAGSVRDYVAYALAAAHRSVHLELSRHLKEVGVQVEAWRLMEMVDSEERVTMTRLAEIVLLNPPTLTKLVDRMVADGLVHRQIGTEDNRQVYLVLTDLGREKMAAVRRYAVDQEDAILRRLGPERARALQDALNTLANWDHA